MFSMSIDGKVADEALVRQGWGKVGARLGRCWDKSQVRLKRYSGEAQIGACQDLLKALS